MKRFPFFLTLAAPCTITIILSACGSSNSAIPAGANAGAVRELGSGYENLYDFKGGHRDGSQPNGQLAVMDGVLYGTTTYGGRRYGNGTVFSLTTSGEEHVIYKFKGGADGASPNGSLLALHGVLYGTTRAGGAYAICSAISENNGCGTVFSVTPSGKERVLYRFKAGADGAGPSDGLTWLDGSFYGATSLGGRRRECPQSGYGEGCGTIFSVDTTGHERVLYRFRGNRDGMKPNGSLLALGGKLYGTTAFGGAVACDHYCGTLFEVTTSGSETVLYRFQGGSDGSGPNGPLIAIDGELYGTTGSGGGTSCQGSSCGHGTVFKATTTGSESVLYSFEGPPDAEDPYGRLVGGHRLLYGTAFGGTVCGEYNDVAGTLFAVSTTGKEHVAYTFPCKKAGRNPSPGLLQLDHVLYGTTYAGGHGYNGTAFAFTP